MSGSSNSLVSRLVDRVFPVMPDFYVMMNKQCDMAFECAEALLEYVETGNPEKAERVAELEHAADDVKTANIDALSKSFSTPMDREDLYRAMHGVDEILNYSKSTIREIEILGLKPDQHMLEMAILMRDGTDALRDGFAKLSENPAAADENALAARKAERRTEKVYRRALAELFSTEQILADMESEETGRAAKAMVKVVDMFKRRELYRHMSNSADRLARASDVLHDIVVKIS